jgi:hypothetical protein
MHQPYSRISENLLFVLLIAAVAGWFTAPVALELHLASRAGTCLAAASEVEALS